MLIQIIALVGAVVILTAFGAAQVRKMKTQSVPYQVMNLVGGALLCLSAVVERQYGFILLEGSWTILSALGLVKVVRARDNEPGDAT